MKKLLMVFILGMFLVGFVSALDFDNIKEFDKNKGAFGEIKVYNSFLVIFKGDLIAEHELNFNNFDLYNGYAIGRTTLHQKDTLFDKFNFYDKKKEKSKESQLSSLKISVYKLSETTSQVPTYNLTCEEKFNSNGTSAGERCISIQNGTREETEEVYTLIPYNFKEKLDPGTYEWRIHATRNNIKTGTIDWTFQALGIETTEWAPWWNTDYSFRRPINGTNSSFIMAVNRSGNQLDESDVDGDGDPEVLYGIPNNGYIYYGNTTNTRNANTTTELCVYDSLNNKSSCPSISSGLKLFLPLDDDWGGVGSLSDNIIKYGTTSTGFSHPAGTVNGSYHASTSATNGTHYRIKDDADNDFGTGDFALVWDNFIPSTQSTATWIFTKSSWYIWMNGAVSDRLEFYDGSIVLFYNLDISDDQWRCMVVQRSGTNLTMWFNGTLVNSTTYSGDLSNTGDVLLGYNGGGRDQYMDDVYVFKGRALNKTEINEICLDKYNSFLGSEEVISTAPLVSQRSPVERYNSSSSSVAFGGLVKEDDSAVANLSLIINDTYYQTNSSGLNNTIYNFSQGLSDGYYSWWFEACDTNPECLNTSVRNLTVDTLVPHVNLTYPTGNVGQSSNGSTLFLNWTATDLNLMSCVFNHEGTNYSVPCSQNYSVINVTNPLQRSVTFWANDTVGNINKTTTSWNYTFFLISETFDASVTEGTTSEFRLNVSTPTTNDIISAYLWYNSTATAGTVYDIGSGIWTIDYNKTIPSVSANTTVSFFWEVNLEDGSQFNLSANNQTIVNIDIDNCGVYTAIFYNFTVYDEETLSYLNDTNKSVNSSIDFTLYNADKTVSIASYSTSFTNKNPFQLCLVSALAGNVNYKIDTQVQYWADGYSKEFYNIKGDTITSADMYTNVSLYDLVNTSSQTFEILYKDASFLPVANAVIQIQRKYIGEGIFRTVEQPLTGTLGETVAHLQLNDVIYNFVTIVNGQVISTFSNKIAQCPNPTLVDCVITLNDVFSGYNPTDFSTINGATFSVQYNHDSRTISLPFTVTSGSSGRMVMNVTKFDNFGNSSICNKELTSSGGTLSCVIPSTFGNGSALVDIYLDGNHIGQSIISLSSDPSDIYGAARIFLAICMLLSLVAIGLVGEPVVAGVFVAIAFIFLMSFNLVASTGFIGAGATVLWLVIAIVLVLIKGGNR